MRHIYRIYPDQTYNTIDDSISAVEGKYASLCSEQGITVPGGVNYKMSVDDIALLYRQRSVNTPSISHDNCICFAVGFGNVGILSIDDCASKTRIVNVTDDITDGEIILEDSTRYIINNLSSAITFVIPDTTSEYVQNYEIDLTIGETSVEINFPENMQWIGNQPTFEINKRYLICIDGNLGLYTEI